MLEKEKEKYKSGSGGVMFWVVLVYIGLVLTANALHHLEKRVKVLELIREVNQ